MPHGNNEVEKNFLISNGDPRFYHDLSRPVPKEHSKLEFSCPGTWKHRDARDINGREPCTVFAVLSCVCLFIQPLVHAAFKRIPWKAPHFARCNLLPELLKSLNRPLSVTNEREVGFRRGFLLQSWNVQSSSKTRTVCNGTNKDCNVMFR